MKSKAGVQLQQIISIISLSRLINYSAIIVLSYDPLFIYLLSSLFHNLISFFLLFHFSKCTITFIKLQIHFFIFLFFLYRFSDKSCSVVEPAKPRQEVSVEYSQYPSNHRTINSGAHMNTPLLKAI